MFLKLFKTSLLVSSLFVSATSFAEGQIIAPGSYELVEGESALCPSFSITEKKISSNILSISSLYTFSLLKSSKTVESDLDPDCEFKEDNLKESENNKIVLTRVNEEICKGKTSSKIRSTVTLNENEVRLRHEVDDAEPLVCIWKKK